MLYDPKWEETIPEVKLQPWQEILLKAANIIEEKGWIKGQYHNAEGYCAIGALRASSDLDGRDYMIDGRDYMIACDMLEISIAAAHGYISLWNDTAASKEVVINKLREVARAV